MSDIYRCENCKFSVQTTPTGPENTEFGNLACRRFPPIPYDTEEGKIKSFVLPVNHNWWCGEWKAKSSA